MLYDENVSQLQPDHVVFQSMDLGKEKVLCASHDLSVQQRLYALRSERKYRGEKKVEWRPRGRACLIGNVP
jgi:hypothetical protein